MSLVLRAIRGSLWRSLPLFRVKKFNRQEMDGQTLKVEIAKSGAPAATTASTAAAAGTASRLERRTGGVS